jgi:hypothetical protein
MVVGVKVKLLRVKGSAVALKFKVPTVRLD